VEVTTVATALRKTGISVVGDMPWGTHFCSFYETKEDLLDILIPFFKTGLESNEFCLWVVSNSELLTVDEARSALQAVVPDLDRHIVDRSIEIVGHDDWFLNGGSFDFHRVANRFKEKVDEALSRGYAGMRVNGSPAWLQTSDPNLLLKFEEHVNQLFSHERIIASCTYPLPDSRAEFLLDVARNHQFAIARRRGIWDIVETPELSQAKAEIERLNAELEKRVIERTNKLEATTARLRGEIEERKEAEEALRQSEERFAAFMDNLPGYAWMKDLQGRYVYVNEMVRRLPGYRSLGKTDAQIWPADLAAEYRANDEQVIATKKPLNTLEHYFQLRGEKRYMAGSKFPIFDKTGAVALVGGAGVDITERIEAEAALRESEAKLKQAQHLANIGYWERDLIADRIAWSKETGRILGRESSRGVLSQAQLREFIHPDDWQHHQQVLNEALQGSRLFDVEVRVVRPDGNIRFVHIRDEIVRDESGKPIRMFGAVQDVTERRRAEEAVRRSEEHLRLVIDTIPTMAWSLRPDGVVDFLNQRWLDYAGLSLEQYVKDPTGPIHPDDVPRVMERWRAQMAIGEGYEDEMRLRRADGEYRWFLVRTEPLHDEHGKIVEWYGVSTDIEDRKRAELEARTLINAIPDQIWSGPPDGTNDYVNDRWRAETGLGLEEMRGDGWQNLLHPDDRERVLKAWQYSVQTGTPYEQEERHRTAHGTYRWYLNRGVPLRDDEGRIIRWYGTNTDIEDRRQAEEKLRHSEVQLAQAQRLAHVGSWDWDLLTNKVTWSDELYRIFGLEPGAVMVAGDAMTFIHPDDQDLVWSTIKDAIANEGRYSFYYRALRPDGTERIVHSRGDVLTDDHGKPIRVFGASQDVTELKRAEEKLKETSEQLRALSARVQSAREEEAARIARELHDELGSALTSLKWDLELISKFCSNSATRQDLSTLLSKTERMISLTDATINTVRRIASDLRPGILDDLGLLAAIEWQAQQFESRSGITCKIDSFADNLQLNQEQSTAIFRILQEALTNVLRHSQASKVNIVIEQTERDFVLEVRDNGRGIREDEINGSHSLGLIGMRERAQLLGGVIEIAGSGDRGTVLTLRVPIRTESFG
jgi:PAS domain S-box-containing protein